MGDLDVEFEESNLVPGQKFAKETPELLERALGKFRQMANSVSGETRSDNYLMKFLRARKFDLDRSLKLLRDHEEYRDKNGLANVSKSEFTDLDFDSCAISAPANVRDREGRQVVMLDGAKYARMLHYFKDRDKFRRFVWLLYSALTESEQTQKSGVRLVANMGALDVPWTQLRHDAACRKMILEIIQKKMPVRIGSIIVYKETTIMWAIFKIVVAFMGDKLKSRLNMVGDEYGSIHAAVDNKLLPTYLEGSGILVETGSFSPLDCRVEYDRPVLP